MQATVAATAETQPDGRGSGVLVHVTLSNQTGADVAGLRLRVPVPAGVRAVDSWIDAPGRHRAAVEPGHVTWHDIRLRAGDRAGPFAIRLAPALDADGAAIFRSSTFQPEVTWTHASRGNAALAALPLRGLWGEEGLRRTLLPTGLTVLTQERPETRTVALQMAVRAGSRDENEITRGGSHWLEHAFLLGTLSRPDNQAIFSAISRVGGNINASTSFEWTNYYNTVPADEFDLSLDVLADQLLNSTFPREAFDRERAVVAEEIKRANDTPAGRATREFFKLVFQVSPLRQDVLGTVGTVESIPIETILAYREERYVTGNMALAAIGNLSHDAAVAKIERAFEALRRGPGHARAAAPEPRQTAPRRAKFGDGARLSELRFGWPAPGRNDPEWAAVAILQDILGTTGRRLTEEIRDRRALATSIGPSYSSFTDAGAFLVVATTQPAREDEVVALSLAEVQRVRAGDVSEEDVQTSLRAIAGRQALSNELNEPLAGRAIGEVLGTLESQAEALARLRQVTAADVQRVAQHYFDPATYTLVAVRA